MYLISNFYIEQINKSNEISYKPGMDLLIHWLGSLLNKCMKRLYPEEFL